MPQKRNKILSLIMTFAICVCLDMPASSSGIRDSLSVTTSELADKLIEEAMKYRGVPYRYGGKGPNAFDCSGFTSYVYGRIGYKLSGSVALQVKETRTVTGNLSDLQKGDLIIFGSRHNVSKIGHVGIYIGPDEPGDGFDFIHAAVHGGIQISNIKEKYYTDRFLGVCRVLPDFYKDSNLDSIDSLIPISDRTFVPVCDTLRLNENDCRIILFADGRWFQVQPDGKLVPPDGENKIVLSQDGRWMTIPKTEHLIPLLED